MRAWTMSSETSTDVGAGLQTGPRGGLHTGPRDDALQPWQLFTLAGLVGATIVVFMARGQSPAAVILLSLTIFTAAAVAVAAWRTFSPIAEAEESVTTPAVVGGRTRAALEREKALALRSIKELEFDRAMGKVSDKDFAEMSARLRTRAAGLLRQLDAGAGYRDQIERELAKRVTRGPQPPSRDASAVRQSLGDGGGSAAQAQGSTPQTQGSAPRPQGIKRTCASCNTVNDKDARFCKHCGAAMEQLA
jgi:hypothetical protein